jgi:predicted ester cyclase
VKTEKNQAMKPVEIVNEFIAAMESGDVDKAATFLSDDFTMSGLTPLPMYRDQYLDTQRGILAAFPDWSYNLTDIQEEAGVIRATAHFTGTHTGDLIVPVPDLPVIKATGKRIALPGETHLYSVRGSKISTIHVLVVPGGGFQGIYRQVGSRLPLPSIIEG